MHSGVRVTARATERKRRRREQGTDLPTVESEESVASGSGQPSNAPHIAPVPTPGVSMAAQVAAAGLRIVQENPMSGPSTASQHNARGQGKKRGGRP